MKLEESVKEILSFLPEIIQQADNGISITDPNQDDNPLIYVNAAFCKTYGYTFEEAVGRNCRFLQGENGNQEGIDDLRSAIKNKQTITRVLKNYTKGGDLVHTEVTISPIFSGNKLKYFLGIQKNITEKIKLQETINISQSLSNVGNWEFDIVNNKITWSDEIYKIFEVNRSETNMTYESYLNLIHPEDKDKVNYSYSNSLKTKKRYSVQHRLLFDGGRIKFVEGRGDTYFDGKGAPVRSVGTVQDITEIKEIEIELKKTLSLLESHKLAIDESCMVSKSDLKGYITYVNDKFCSVSKYSRQELLGKPHSIIRHPDNPKEIFRDLWETIKAQKVWKKILKNIDKEGNDYWVDVTILPITADDNSTVEYIAVRHDITNTINQQLKLDSLANTDDLTGLGSRNKLLNDISTKVSPALVILNIDRFSQINNFYGYEVGDYFLKQVAFKLIESNASENCCIYHINADEFMFLYSGISNDTVISFVRGIEEKLSKQKIKVSEDYLNLSFTLSISFEAKDLLLSTADVALKEAKKTNTNMLIYSDSISKEQEYENNIKWANTVKEALRDDKVIPVFQPIVNNQTMEWEKYEALVRIEAERLITPFFFLEISKKTRHYSAITKTMIKKSFDIFKNRNEEFSINLTVKDILNSEIKDFIVEMLEKHNNGKTVVFEIVESESIELFEDISNFVDFVKARGCKIAIDDFGTGYSNFEYLVKLKADYVKIDGSLIRDIDTNKTSEIVCKNIVNFSKDLNMKTIAEFVENESILNKVKEIGIDYSQGYFFSEPKKMESIKS